MKTRSLAPLFSIVFLLSISAQAQEFSLGVNYAYTNPTGGMSQYIRNGNGFVTSLNWTAPSQRITAGFEINWSNYSSSMTEQDYEFPDGTIAPMNIQVNNGFTNYMGTMRIWMVTKGLVRPYAELKAGASVFTTKLLILDPNDLDNCEPVESEILKRESTMAYSAGGGLRVDIAAISRARVGRAFIDVSMNATQGGRVDYMNTNAPMPTQQHTAPRNDQVQAEFVNTQTQVVHKHHVGYVYSSYLRATDFRLGMSFTLGCGSYQQFE